MKHVVIGAHLQRDDIEPVATALPVGDLFLSAVGIDDDHPLGDRELLIRVADTRAKLLTRSTFIAIRYGFAAASPTEAFDKVAAHLRRWRSILEANRNNVEMTLKVAASQPTPRPRRSDFTRGAEYLRALHTATSSVTIDKDFREKVERTLLPFALKYRWANRDEKSAELSLLVPRQRVQDFLDAGEALRGTPVAFLLSGPWPLEVFADDHE